MLDAVLFGDDTYASYEIITIIVYVGDIGFPVVERQASIEKEI